ncbi:hypothetical protein B0I37DRAFT_376904 [Chaetomium sp. MPI-CAGE-AT-0009]|nr:hypothetical protein B0I37DRAFT_376904 [Chaetomium sp. MPI-CAGE-AT-0009]
MQRYFATYKKNYEFEQIWLSICREDEKVLPAIQSYIRDYIESSQISRPSLHEKEEYETVQTVTTTKTIVTHWRSLVTHANNTLLREKRQEDPENRSL